MIGMKLTDKTIVLTGASSGVGFELLARLSSSNRVIALSRTAPDLARNTITHLACDLADATSVASAIRQIRQLSDGAIDGLINCGAVQYTPRFTDQHFDPSTIARETAINFTSPIELIAGLLDRLRAAPQAFIVNVNSGLGIVPKHESAIYCATKAGLDNFSRGLRAQLAGSDVTVQQAFLPLVDTPMTEGRGSGKLSPGKVADRIIHGIQAQQLDMDIGKVKLLRLINRLSPRLAHRIMQKGE